MHWNDDALKYMSRIPEDVRGVAERMVEQWAMQEDVEVVTIEMIVDLRQQFEKRYGTQKKCPLFRSGKNE